MGQRPRPIRRVDSGKIYSNVKETIFVTHGFSTSTAFMAPLIDHLRETTSYKIVAIDHAGHDASEGEKADFVGFTRTICRMIENIRSNGEILRAIVAHSVGAKTATIAAAQRPELFSGVQGPLKVIFIEPPFQPKTLMVPFCKAHGIRLELVEHMREAFRPSPDDVIERECFAAQLKADAASFLVITDEDDKIALTAEAETFENICLDRGVSIRLENTKGLGHFKGIMYKSVWQLTLEFLRD